MPPKIPGATRYASLWVSQEKANEASAATLQEIAEKEQAAKDIMHSLNKQFTIFANKILPSEKQQSVPRWDNGES